MLCVNPANASSAAIESCSLLQEVSTQCVVSPNDNYKGWTMPHYLQSNALYGLTYEGIELIDVDI